MPDDFLSNLMEIGSDRGGWRSGLAIFGLLAGAALGGYLGYAGGVGAAIGGVGSGALIGWVAAVVLKGFLRTFLLFIAILAAILLWYWLTGRI